MSLPNIAPLVLDLILGRLVPWFLAATADPQAARDAARSLLASYNVETEAEAHLAAEAICLSFGVLEALGRSADPDLSVNAVLRLRGSANAMHRSAHKSLCALQALRQQRQAAAEPPAATASADPVQVTPAAQAEPPKPVVLSRQQRRALERSQEKARRQQAEQARRDAMRARRTAAMPPQPASQPAITRQPASQPAMARQPASQPAMARQGPVAA